MIEKKCKICGKNFLSKNSNVKTCSIECRKKNNKINLRRNQKKYLERHPDRRKKTCYKYSIKNKEKLRKKAKEWRDKNPEKVLAQVYKWRKKNREKRNAQAVAQKNIKIKKNTLCEICNKNKAIQRHHTDYSKPLKVIFVCTKCHHNLHKKICWEVWNEKSVESQ